MSETRAVRNRKVVEQFGPRLEKALEAKGVTKRQVAEASGLTYDSVVKLCRGDRNPNLSTVVDLANALNLEVEMLLHGQGR